jgi:hypothetical protein
MLLNKLLKITGKLPDDVFEFIQRLLMIIKITGKLLKPTGSLFRDCL